MHQQLMQLTTQTKKKTKHKFSFQDKIYEASNFGGFSFWKNLEKFPNTEKWLENSLESIVDKGLGDSFMKLFQDNFFSG